MKNKKETLLILTILITICIIIFNRDKLYEAKYTEPKDTLLAITINGEISTTFPTTNAYTGTVECTTGTGKVEWNGTKWVLTTSRITKGSTKCNATFVTAVPAPDGWYDAGSGTLLASLRDNNELGKTITTPGAAVSTADEAILASTEDDYGTSYYFRGAVTNNYIEFANKCWRIVRITGAGSIKLILHNDNVSNVSNPCSSANNSTTAAFAHYNGSTYKSVFNTNGGDNAYVGFKYGTRGSSTYPATHANTHNSTILNNLETWYNNNLTAYESVIDDTVWCNDKTNVTDTTYNPMNYKNVNGLGFGTNETYYGATQRLVSASKSAGGTGPSLKCNGELSKITSEVGLITADELAFAGYAYGKNNTTTYLQENATYYTNWWSLSPYTFNSYNAYVWSVGGSTGSFDGNFDGSSGNHSSAVRPSISLISSTNVTGDGTSENPYVVEK